MSCSTRSLSFLSPRDEPGGARVLRPEDRRQVLPGLFSLRVQALDLEDLPVTHQRQDHVIVVDPEVVNARPGYLRSLARESRYRGAWHREPADLVGDRPDGLVGRELKSGLDEVAVEDHVQVLVHRDPGEQSLGDGVFAGEASVAMSDTGR